MVPSQITPVEPGHRIQLPAEWAEAFGLSGTVSLDKTAEGILVRPNRQLTWDEVFTTKLVIGSAVHDQNDDLLELTGDDFLF